MYTVLLLSILVASCAPMKMSVSDELRSSNDEYSVKGRNGSRIKQKLSFGEYQTSSLKRSWTKGNSARVGFSYTNAQQEWVNLISMEYIRKRQTVRFELTDGNNVSEVYCVSRFNARELELGKRENSFLNIGMDLLGIGGRSTSTYYVQLHASLSDERPWEMIIDNQASQAKPKEYIGYIAKSRSEYYSIVPVRKLEKNGKSGNILAGSIGYEFRNPQGKPVAAVSLIDNGMVFMGKVDAKERFVLANACAALLLQDEIE